jgi:DNA-binding transcriptional LysR family regulator
VSAVRLTPIRLVPYAAPGLIQTSLPMDAAAMRELPLLHLHEAPRAWEAYFRLLGSTGVAVPAGAQHTLLLVNCEAALAGLGAALLPPEFVAADEQAGRLVRLAAPELLSDRSYFLIWRDAASERIAALREWMTQALAEQD